MHTIFLRRGLSAAALLIAVINGFYTFAAAHRRVDKSQAAFYPSKICDFKVIYLHPASGPDWLTNIKRDDLLLSGRLRKRRLDVGQRFF